MNTVAGRGKNLRNAYGEQGEICTPFVLAVLIAPEYLTSFLLQYGMAAICELGGLSSFLYTWKDMILISSSS